MTHFTVRQAPFLQVRANFLTVTASRDGTVLHPVMSRFMRLYPSAYARYRELAHKGELKLGDCLVFDTPKQVAGLGIANPQTADTTALLVVKEHPSDKLLPSALGHALGALSPVLFQKMRYEGLRRVAVFAGDLGDEAPLLWQLVQQKLTVARLSIDVYIDHQDPNLFDKLPQD